MSGYGSVHPERNFPLAGTMVYKKKKQDIYDEAQIREALIHDPRIEDVSNISVEYERLGFLKGRRLHIIGKVRSDLDKKTAEEIVREHAEKKVEISNELQIGS